MCTYVSVGCLTHAALIESAHATGQDVTCLAERSGWLRVSLPMTEPGRLHRATWVTKAAGVVQLDLVPCVLSAAILSA